MHSSYYNRSHFVLTQLHQPAQSGEESVLVGSLREVIAKQASEIESLRNKLKELTTNSVTAAETASASASQSAAKFDQVCLSNSTQGNIVIQTAW